MREYSRKNYKKNRENHIIASKKWNTKNKERCKINRRNNYQKNKERWREYYRKYRQLHPRSNTNYSYELQDAMNNVRKRDNNTCQWYGCGLSHRDTTIHVHHIFPRSEYPELELVEQYMICYCLNHHAQWHKYRGDYYANAILGSRVNNSKLIT